MNLESIVSQIAQTIQQEANVEAIFGPARKLDEHVIIPVARVEVKLNAGGGGLGARSNGRGQMQGGYEQGSQGQMGGQSQGGQSQQGAQSAQSERGEKSERGQKGEKGEKGEKSEKGERGGQQTQGEKSQGGQQTQGEKSQGGQQSQGEKGQGMQGGQQQGGQQQGGQQQGGQMQGGEMSEQGQGGGLMGNLPRMIMGMGGGTGVGAEFEIEVVPVGFIRDGKNGAEFVSIDQTPEGLLGRIEHLVKNLRSSGSGNGRQSESKGG